MRKRPKPYHGEHLDEIDCLKVVRRFLAKVAISTTRGLDGLPEWCWGCWEWTGYRDKKGYGQIKYEKRAHWTHRISYAIWKGVIRRRKTVNHECFNQGCCNPFHLTTMSHSKNSAMKKPKAATNEQSNVETGNREECSGTNADVPAADGVAADAGQ